MRTGQILQTTIKSPVTFTGQGLHTGESVRLTIRPASAEHGIWFKRSDLDDGGATLIPARYDVAEHSPLCTKLVNERGVSVSTVEHVMAALVGCGIHNALVEVDGPEVPILDGSAAPFVRGIMQRGVQNLYAEVRAFEVLKTVEIKHGDAIARIAPSDELKIEFHIDFEDAAIGQQSKVLNMSNGSFARELCDSRTFCRQSDVETMQANGLALGGAPGENAVVFEGDRVLSGSITVREPLGGETLIYVDSPAGEFIAKADGRSPPDIGTHVELGAMPENLHLFDAETGDAVISPI